MRLQGCANILEHTCLSSNGQSGSSMWDASLGIRAILTGKVGAPCEARKAAFQAEALALCPAAYERIRFVAGRGCGV